MAQSFSHFSHFGSSTHKMARQSAARLSDSEPSKSYGYTIMSGGGRSISCETFLSLRSGATESQRGQPRKKNAKLKDTGRVKYIYRFGKRDASRRCSSCHVCGFKWLSCFSELPRCRRPSLRSTLNNGRTATRMPLPH